MLNHKHFIAQFLEKENRNMSKRLSYVVVCLAFLMTLVSACQSEPTPIPTPVPPTATAVPPTPTAIAPLEEGTRAPLWTFATQGEIWGSPAVADGTVYIGSDDHFLYAVDTASAQLKWKFETGD